MVSLVFTLFEELENRVESIFITFRNKNKHFEFNEVFSGQLEDWRHDYDIVCQFVDQLNKSFGHIILIIIAYTVSESIATFYESVSEYAYTVQIFMAFDIKGMMKEVNSTTVLLKLENHTLKSHANKIENLENFHNFLLIVASLVEVFKFFVQLSKHFHQTFQLWFRLLIILVPSYRMTKKVVFFKV